MFRTKYVTTKRDTFYAQYCSSYVIQFWIYLEIMTLCLHFLASILKSTVVFRMYTKITEVTTADLDLKRNQYFQGNDVNIQRHLKALQNS
jgi:hypothetical protein